MMKYLPIILAISMIIAGCAQKADAIVKLDEEFNISPNQTASIPSEGLTLRFVSVIADSRCPQDVQCIWAGQTTILAEAEKSGNRTSFEITKKAGTIGPGVNESQGYSFQFVDISPSKNAGENLSDSEISATFVIRKLVR